MKDKDVFNTGEQLYVNWAEKKSDRMRKLREQYLGNTNETNLFTKNLKEDVTEEILEKAYSCYGEITSVCVRKPPISDKPYIKKT